MKSQDYWVVKYYLDKTKHIFHIEASQKWYDEEKKAHENASKGKGKQTLVDPSGKVNVPAFENATKQFKGKTGYK